MPCDVRLVGRTGAVGERFEEVLVLKESSGLNGARGFVFDDVISAVFVSSACEFFSCDSYSALTSAADVTASVALPFVTVTSSRSTSLRMTVVKVKADFRLSESMVCFEKQELEINYM